MKNLLMLFILTIFTLSCQKEEDANGDGLQGNWVYVGESVSVHENGYEESTLLRRTKKLDKNNFSIGFYENDYLIDNANSGWCGTPPITYAQYEGNWSMSDNIVDYQCAFWGGQKKVKFEIISVDQEYLKIKILDNEYIYDR